MYAQPCERGAAATLHPPLLTSSIALLAALWQLVNAGQRCGPWLRLLRVPGVPA